MEILWIQVPPKKILYPPNCNLSAFLAATWINRESLFFHVFIHDPPSNQTNIPQKTTIFSRENSTSRYALAAFEEMKDAGIQRLGVGVSEKKSWILCVFLGCCLLFNLVLFVVQFGDV